MPKISHYPAKIAYGKKIQKNQPSSDLIIGFKCEIKDMQLIPESLFWCFQTLLISLFEINAKTFFFVLTKN